MVTQDTSLRGKAEVCDEDLFGRAKTGGLGQVTRKKNDNEKKKSITRPRPDGRVISLVWCVKLHGELGNTLGAT